MAKKAKKENKGSLGNTFPLIAIRTIDGSYQKQPSLINYHQPQMVLTVRHRVLDDIGNARLIVQYSPEGTEELSNRWLPAKWEDGEEIVWTGEVGEQGPAVFPSCGETIRVLLDINGEEGLIPLDFEGYLI
jgi:hypothetical protein